MSRAVILQKFLFVFCLLVSASFSKHSKLTPVKSATFSITIKITNVRNTKGRIQLQIYRNQESFSKEVPWKITYISKKKMVGNSITHTISGFGSGVYGLALLDDENNNTKMDYGWVLPKEGFGFSDYYHTAWSKPKFNSFTFYLKANKRVTMRVRYA